MARVVGIAVEYYKSMLTAKRIRFSASRSCSTTDKDAAFMAFFAEYSSARETKGVSWLPAFTVALIGAHRRGPTLFGHFLWRKDEPGARRACV